MKIYIPMRLPSLANCRMHWRALAKLKKQQRLFVALHLPNELPSLPATIRLTRIGKRLLDSDNLAISFKSPRDQIADHYGVDDGSPLYRWVYEQRIGKEYGIEIEVIK